MTPTKMVANSMFGETQVQNSWSGLPCRSSSGMNSAPPGLDGGDLGAVVAFAYDHARGRVIGEGVLVGYGHVFLRLA